MTSLWGLVHYLDSFFPTLWKTKTRIFFLIPLNNNNNNNSKTFGDRGLVRAQIVLIIQKFQKF